MLEREPGAAICGRSSMGLTIRHVVWASAVLAVGSFVYVVAFEPMGPSMGPQAGSVGRVPSRSGLISTIRRSLAQGQVVAAMRVSETLVRNFPDDPSAMFWRGISRRLGGNIDSSTADFATLDWLLDGLASWPDRYSEAQLDYFRGWGKFGIGDLDSSRVWFTKIADDLEARSTPDGGEITRSGVLYNLACYRAMSGETEAAIEFWERAVEHGYGQDGGWWAVDPDLESLHGDARFWEASAKIWSRERDDERVLIEVQP
jgi:hypothetical protein